MFKNFLFFMVVLFITFGVIECSSRVILPISPGTVKTDLEGHEIEIEWNSPSTTYIQKSPEWTLPSTNDEYGNRVVPTAVPTADRVLFLGDSFTYGLGVSDEDSIPSVVCEVAKLNCINLGVPGSGLVIQRDKVMNYIQRSGEEPILAVYHLIMASTEQNYSGNDITDTNRELQKDSSVPVVNASDEPVLLKVARWSSQNSNFVRIMRYQFGSWLRGVLFNQIDSKLSEEEIKNFIGVLLDIKENIEKEGILYIPVLVSPYSELANETYVQTIDQVQKYSGIGVGRPEYSNIAAAPLFYPLDGHFNEVGARFYGDFIVKEYF